MATANAVRETYVASIDGIVVRAGFALYLALGYGVSLRALPPASGRSEFDAVLGWCGR